MKKTLGATILICAGLSFLTSPAAHARELRPLLKESAPVLSSPLVVAQPAKMALAVAPVTTALAVAPAIAPSVTVVKLAGPVIAPGPIKIIPGPIEPVIIIYPTTPIIYPTTPLSPP